MDKPNVTVKIKSRGAVVGRLDGRFQSVLPQLSDTILSDCNEYVPVKTGALRNSGHLEDGGKKIVWNVKYALKRYFTGNPSHAVNPNASLRWCEVATRRHKDEWANRATKLIGR